MLELYYEKIDGVEERVEMMRRGLIHSMILVRREILSKKMNEDLCLCWEKITRVFILTSKQKNDIF